MERIKIQFFWLLKITCTNHATKNYSKDFYAIKKNTKQVSLEAIKLLSTETIKMLQKEAQKAIKENAHSDIILSKRNIKYSVQLTFKDYAHCKNYLCTEVGEVTNDHIMYAELNTMLSKGHMGSIRCNGTDFERDLTLVVCGITKSLSGTENLGNDTLIIAPISLFE